MISINSVSNSTLMLWVLFWLAWLGSTVRAASPPASIWETDLSAACRRAQAEAKPLVVYISSSVDVAHANASRALETGPLANRAMASFSDWAVMVKVGRESLIPKGTDSALMRTIDVTETPAVAVVVQHRNGWHSYGQIIGDFKPSEFIRILRGDVALAMIAVRRDAYDALPAGDRARHGHKVEGQCIDLQRRGNAVEKSYNQLLDRLRDDGQFSAKEFAATAHTRARILKQWVMAVADLSALSEQRDSVLCEVVLNLYLLECDVNRRLAKNLVACTESDRLANSNAVETAQKLVRDWDKERKLEAQVVQETVAGAGRIHRGRSCSNRRKPGT